MEKAFLAVDIGGTKLAAGVITPAGSLLAEGTVSTNPVATPSEVIEALLRLAECVVSRVATGYGDFAALGISFGGPVEYESGTVITCHHLSGWEGVPLRKLLLERTGLPAVMDNDANAAALGETVFGAARGCEDILYVTVSTGIGAGLVLGGRVHRGVNSMAGELGHTQLVPFGPRCTCGRLGCLESVAAGWAIVRDVRLALDGGAESALRSVPREDLSARHVAEMAQTDELAARVMLRVGEYLGLGLARAVNLLNPEMVVLGGGLVQAGDVLLDPVRRNFAKYIMPETAEGLRIVVGDLAPRWGLYGAAALALREIADGS
ncbi:MAG: ROK family protein [Armatimonadetes bacterium]|nr:ROK family protein [Armatimonadota bacterium]